MTKMMTNKEILEKSGGRNCGLCGMKTCGRFVEIVHFGVLRPLERDVFYGGE
jgi:hypothetical protein